MVDKGVRVERWLRVRVAAWCSLLVAAHAGRAEAAGFEKGPYIQHLGTSGVSIKVELSEPGVVTVKVVEPTTRKVAVEKTSDRGRFHELRLGGLSPATVYDYTVTGPSDDAKGETGRFTTAPAENKPFRFVVYGDTRSDHDAHAAVVRAIYSTPSDFLVNTGDMVQNGSNPRDWEAMFAIEKKLLRDRCVFASVGNHELYGGGSGEAAFVRYFGAVRSEEGREPSRLYGSFRWSNTRFFLLNAMDEWTGEEREWLERELVKAASEPGLQHRIAVLHHGPFSSGPHQGNRRLGTAVRIMRENKVDLVLAGHDHVYERGDGGGLKYLISGGGGAPLYERKVRAPQTLAFESVHHFIDVAVDGEAVKIVAKRASGSVIESCGFTAGGPWTCDEGAINASVKEIREAPPPPTAPARAAACSCEAAGASGVPGLGAWSLGLVAAVAVWRRRRG
jgi:acid phosphatase type 7